MPGHWVIIKSQQVPLLNLTDINRNQDGNVYNCTVTNFAIPKTISEQFIILTVHYLSGVIFSSTLNVEEGEDLTVDCTADCNPPCYYVWTLGDNQITTDPLLNLTDISRNQDGNVYNCTVTNSAISKSISDQFALTVLSIGNAIIVCTGGAYLGQMTTIVCEVTLPILEGMRILRPNRGRPQEVLRCNPSNTRCIITGSMTGYSYVSDSPSQTSLTIQSYNPSTDEGEWICRDGTSDVGQDTCNMAFFDGPSSVTFSPRSPTTVGKGESLTVTCIADCTPSCSFSWTRQNQNLSSSSKLELTNISKSHEGVYSCTVRNTSSSDVKSSNFTLIVRGVSVVLSGSSSHAVLNESFTFTCIVTQAAGLIDYVTFYQNTLLGSIISLLQDGGSCSVFIPSPLKGYSVSCGNGTHSNSSTTKNYILNINRAAERDAILWFCGLNTANTISEKISLPVYYGPDLSSVDFSYSSNVEEGQDLTVDCTTDCNPLCDYAWTLGDNQITTSPLLNLTDINRNQDGNVYSCTVTNSAIPKTISDQFVLTVLYDPERMAALSTGAISAIIIGALLLFSIPVVWVVYKRKTKTNAEEEVVQKELTIKEEHQADNTAFVRTEEKVTVTLEFPSSGLRFSDTYKTVSVDKVTSD
ncbi:uncharacterized protein LOC121386214 isoform X2 [Gigantopelta aegis]|uniref:uncharacterized protein LOC121386214 isoform X2 n=1 Tax=Gigantopelta aegis TaxID=1735272 RepID=UPI001B88CA8D|nr:uncharacterized protein LOC121386214 isoform X2 [Gigantopelta aegis]